MTYTDVGKRIGTGTWVVNWHDYLTQNYSGKNRAITPNLKTFSHFYKVPHMYGPPTPQTPNQLNKSELPAYGQPWVQDTVENYWVGPRQSTSPSNASIIVPGTAMSNVGGGEGRLMVELFGAGKPTLSKVYIMCILGVVMNM